MRVSVPCCNELCRASRARHDLTTISTPRTSLVDHRGTSGGHSRRFKNTWIAGVLVGRVLDVGCGSGEHALTAAALGSEATGVDASSNAVAIAARKADERSLTARFLAWNALELAGLGECFDTVLDCGLFHAFDDHDRPAFVNSLRASIPVGCRFYMLCFTELEAGDWGPRVRQDEIRASFVDGWRIERIAPATLEITVEPGSVRAWLASVPRV